MIGLTFSLPFSARSVKIPLSDDIAVGTIVQLSRHLTHLLMAEGSMPRNGMEELGRFWFKPLQSVLGNRQ